MRKIFLIGGVMAVGFSFAGRPETGKSVVANSRAGQISFVENKGQLVDMGGNPRPDFLYKANGTGTCFFLRKTGFTYVLSDQSSTLNFINSQLEDYARTSGINGNSSVLLKKKKELLSMQTLKLNRVDVDFVNCNANPEISASGKTSDITNFYLPQCPKGLTGVNSFKEVGIKNIYDHIDVNYHGAATSGLEYDIIVNPGGDPQQIIINYTGAEKLELKKGRLGISTSLSDLAEFIPHVYQNIDGKIVAVKAAYKLDGTEVSFKLGKWNNQYPLVIDPWVSYFGGPGWDQGSSVAVDSKGYPVFVGETNGGATGPIPVTTGAMQTAYGGTGATSPQNGDAFIFRMDPDGNLLWSTYYGGSDEDDGVGIAVNAAGNILVSGRTYSPDLVLTKTGANVIQQPALAGGSDAFLIELDPVHGWMQWGTYYGGTGDDGSTDVTVDQASGNIYLYGNTSSNGIASGALYQSNLVGANDVFLAKFSPQGSLIWANYIGQGAETGGDVACDPAGNVFFMGSTGTPAGLAGNAPGNTVYQNHNAGGGDAFLFKFDPNGNRLWSTYFGGPAIESGSAIATDPLGNVFIEGATGSISGLSNTAHGVSFQPNINGVVDCYIAKFDNTGNIQWATYLGGSSSEEPAGLACDPYGNVAASGDTYSNDFPATGCSFQIEYGTGTEDQFITSYDANGNMICSGYLGQGANGSPNNETYGNGGNAGGFPAGNIAVYNCYIFLIAASNASYPVTANAYQNFPGGSYDAAIAKVFLSTCGGLTDTTLSFKASSPVIICPGGTVSFQSSYTSCNKNPGPVYNWVFSGGTPSVSNDANPTGIVYANPGIYDVELSVYNCDTVVRTKTAYVIVDSSLVTKSSVADMSCGQKGSITLSVSSGTPSYTYSWSPAGLAGPDVNNLGPGIYTCTITDHLGCTSVATDTVKSQGLVPLNVSILGNDSLCPGSTGTVSATVSSGTAPYTYSWNPGGLTTQQVSLSPDITTTYTLLASDACGSTGLDSIKVNIRKLPGISFTGQNLSGCAPLCADLQGTSIPTFSGSVKWAFGDGDTLTSSGSVTHCYKKPGKYSVIISGKTDQGCVYSRTIADTVFVFPQPDVVFSILPQPATTLSQTVNFNNESSDTAGIVRWLWHFGDGLDTINGDSSNVKDPMHTYTEETKYCIELVAEDKLGCLDSTVNCFELQPGCASKIYVPTAFSPNGDGHNDILYLRGGDCMTDFQFMIFDRWGQVVFQTSDPMTGWDGKRNGVSMSPAVFIYYLHGVITDGTTIDKKGNVTLLK